MQRISDGTIWGRVSPQRGSYLVSARKNKEACVGEAQDLKGEITGAEVGGARLHRRFCGAGTGLILL